MFNTIESNVGIQWYFWPHWGAFTFFRTGTQTSTWSLTLCSRKLQNNKHHDRKRTTTTTRTTILIFQDLCLAADLRTAGWSVWDQLTIGPVGGKSSRGLFLHIFREVLSHIFLWGYIFLQVLRYLLPGNFSFLPSISMCRLLHCTRHQPISSHVTSSQFPTSTFFPHIFLNTFLFLKLAYQLTPVISFWIHMSRASILLS